MEGSQSLDISWLLLSLPIELFEVLPSECEELVVLADHHAIELLVLDIRLGRRRVQRQEVNLIVAVPRPEGSQSRAIDIRR